MKELKNYQQNAIDQLMQFTEMFLKTPKNETIIFQSPTGSGKTITIARYIHELTKETKEDLCFLWISIGKGELQVQSHKSVKKEIGDTIECSLLENEFFGSRDIINQNEIVFVNWEKIRKKDKKTKEFNNTLMKDWEQNNFPTILKNTRENRKIILIIDESHSSATTKRAKEIRDEIIAPNLTIEMSATPVFNSENINARVYVEPTDVINEGMIKKEIIINDKIAEAIEKEENEKSSESLVLESAYYKEEELKKRYQKLYNEGETKNLITPLTLIQIPNSNYGEEKRAAVEKFLKNKGITTENGKLAIWLNDDKINNSYEELNTNDSKVEYLIFKMAIDTGWDCPRAQILLKFREVNSIVFEIQTVGRILRMPEAKHYTDEALNRSYVYSNIQSIAIKKEIYNPNIIKTYNSKVKEEYKPDIKIAINAQSTQDQLNILNIENASTIESGSIIESTSNTENTEDTVNKQNAQQIENQNSEYTQISLELEYEQAIKNIIENQIKKEENTQTNTTQNNEKENATNENQKNNNEENNEENQSKKNEETTTEKKQIMTLKSYYKKRTDYGDITSSFYKVYEREFCKHFNIPEKENIPIQDTITNKEKMKEAGINFEYRKKDSILSDVHIESEKVDEEIEIKEQENLVDIIMSDDDLQNDFEKVIKNNLNGFAPVRSIPTVKTAIISTFGKYLYIRPQNKGIILIQNIVVNNNETFGKIISTATQNYKPIHEYEVDQKEKYEINEEWHIPFDKNYNPNTNIKIESKLSIHQPLYVETKEGKADKLELEFIEYLDKHENSIEYFWKNGSEHMNTNFGIAKEDGTAFQPDFLIQFKDGRIGIFDTKAGKGYNEKDNEIKSNALQQYITDENKKGKNIVGGLVVENNGTFYYYDRTTYKTYKEKPEQWKSFEELVKQKIKN